MQSSLNKNHPLEIPTKYSLLTTLRFFPRKNKPTVGNSRLLLLYIQELTCHLISKTNPQLLHAFILNILE